MKIRKPRPHPWGPYMWGTIAVVSAFNCLTDLWPGLFPAWMSAQMIPTSRAVSLGIDAGFAVAATVLAVRSWRRPDRREGARLVAELAALAGDRQLQRMAWVNRDDHLGFVVNRRYRCWMILRVPEDDIHEAARLAETEGPAPVVYEQFTYIPGTQVVMRNYDAALVTDVGGGEFEAGELPGQPGKWKACWRRLTARGPAASNEITNAELGELIRQLREAERIGEPGQ